MEYALHRVGYSGREISKMPFSRALALYKWAEEDLTLQSVGRVLGGLDSSRHERITFDLTGVVRR